VNEELRIENEKMITDKNWLLKLGVGFFGLALVWMSIYSCKPHKQEVEVEIAVTDTCTYLYDICIDSLDVTDYTIKPGDNLSAIFSKLGMASMTDPISKAAGDLLNPKRLRTGASYKTLTTQDEAATIRYIIFAKSLTDLVIIDLNNPAINVYPYRKEITLKQRYVEGSVKSSLWKEIKKQQVDPMMAIRISDIFAWQIDFFALQEKDSFQVLYTEAFIDDSVSIDIPTIDYATFTHGKKTYTAIPFVQDSIMEYFDADGQSLHKAFLKAPLDFFRISSRFTNARFHPVLKRYRAHHGVDYAAPAGTPVKTIGSGRVIAKGFQADGGGNYVKIQHNAVYTTTYMHLRGFAQGVNVGKQVQQGEVIGYVGSTGLSTGPHLDFRVLKNGEYIDPLKLEAPPSYPVKPGLRDSFEIVKQQLFIKLTDAQSGKVLK
jgi:murein DD-endopeptidase MepM/ murein hydrolase activator NlpD